LALSLVFAGIETTNGVQNSYMFIGALHSEDIRTHCNAIAVTTYGFVLAVTLAAILVFPFARDSIRSQAYFPLAVIITINLTLLILLCNRTAPYFRFP
jgi:hypothetical protein